MPAVNTPYGRAAIGRRYTNLANDELVRFLSALTYQPATSQMIGPLDICITALKAGGYWDTLDAVYIPGLFTEQAGLLNVKEPTLYPLTNSGCTHTPGAGFQGNGTSAFLQGPQWDSFVKFQQDDAHFLQWINGGTDVGATKFSLAGISSVGNQMTLVPRGVSTSPTLSAMNGTAGSTFAVNATIIGCYVGTRTAAGANEMWKNGVSIGTDNDASAGRPASPLSVFRSGSTYADFRSPLLCVGSKVTLAQQLVAYNAFSAFFTAAGITP